MKQDVTLFADERLDEVNEHLRLIQKKNGLTFGTDAFLLAAYMRAEPRGVAVELGAGTGIISLLCATRQKFRSIHACEIQEPFAELCVRNAAVNGLSDRIIVHACDLRELSPAAIGREADTVFANPPYMRTDSGKRNEHDEKYIARHEVCGTVSDFCHAAARLLKHGGRFYCVWRPDRLCDLMRALEREGLEPKQMTFVHAHEKAEPSMVLVCAVKGGASSVRISPPLLLQHSAADKALSDTAALIYEHMSFEPLWKKDKTTGE